MADSIFEAMARSWKAPIVARAEVSKFTGGAVSGKTLANADCAGTGPKERLLIGRRCCYPVPALIDWLKAHTKEVSSSD